MIKKKLPSSFQPLNWFLRMGYYSYILPQIPAVANKSPHWPDVTRLGSWPLVVKINIEILLGYSILLRRLG
jgi:hypothetical protein